MRPLLYILITLASISAHAQFKRADSPPPVAPVPATVSATATATAPASPAVASTVKTKKASKKGPPAIDGATVPTVADAAPLSEKDRMAKLHVALDTLLATTGK